MNDKQQQYNDLLKGIENCKKCRLCEGRNNIVPGDGSINAQVVFVGEGPGKDEDLQGKPFVGQAGKFLSELLAGIGISREDVFITNVVKCRPPNNRDPQEDEIETCIPYLREQIKLIKPKVICTLGKHALKTMISKELNISPSHGKLFKKGSFHFFAHYHPAAALYNPNLRSVIQRDFVLMKAAVEKVIKEEEEQIKVRGLA